MKLQRLKIFIKPITVSALMAFAFLGYVYFIGSPKTKASAYYNQALLQQGLGATKRADEYFKKSIESFPEEVVLKEYQKFQAAK